MQKILFILLLFFLTAAPGCLAENAKAKESYVVFDPNGKILFITEITPSIGDQFYDGTNWYEITKVKGHQGYTKIIPASQSISANNRRKAAWELLLWRIAEIGAVLFLFITAILVLLFKLRRKPKRKLR